MLVTSSSGDRTVSNNVVRMSWQCVLPVIGLLLFLLQSYESYRNNQNRRFHRYFYWSSIRLDSDPLNKQYYTKETGSDMASEERVAWDPEVIWVDPGWLSRLLMISALPAFVVGAAVVVGLGRLGVSQILTFMISMPVLISAWYGLISWLIDRWRLGRLRSKL